MTRAERMMELADRLRGRDATSVADLAGELSVSRRTLLRDLATLRKRGMPITGEAGPGGGVRLEGERGLLAVHLSLAEVISLWLAARLSQGTGELPWGKSATSALAKLLASLPAARSRALRSLCQRVIVGETAGPVMRADLGVAPPELLGVFEEAFSAGRGLGFQYTDVKGQRSARRVEPHGLLVVAPSWYVLARDVDRGAPRMFRMDRIARPRLLADIMFTPDLGLIRSGFSHPERWRPLTGRWTVEPSPPRPSGPGRAAPG